MFRSFWLRRRAAFFAHYHLAYRLLASNFRLYWKRYLVAFLAMAVQAGCTAASAYMIEHIINDALLGGSFTTALVIAFITVAIFLAKGLGTYISSIILNRIGNNMIARLQNEMFQALMRQDLGFFNKYPFGELISRISNNAQAARSLMQVLVMSAGRDVVTLVSLATLLVVSHPAMSLTTIAVLPVAAAIINYLARRIKATAYQEVISIGRMVNVMRETMQGIRVLKAFRMENQMRERMGRAIRELEALSNRVALLSARSRPLMDVLGGFVLAFTVLYGGYNVIVLNQSPGGFFSFMVAFLLAYEPAKRLTQFNIEIEAQLVGVRMMFEILDAVPEIRDDDDAIEFVADHVEIELRNVSFHYKSGTPVIGDVSFSAGQGTVTALVGPSGAGKSTILALIERFYDPSAGAILFNGIDIRRITLASLRRHIAIVTQDTFLFEGSLAANIADGDPSASREAIIEAARDANAFDFIMALPDGFETMVTQGGGNLSGGQRQRISIARALLRRSPVLLLDEATSALDAQAEAEVREALARLMAGRTALVIAHRLSTVRNADRIHVFDHGSLVQSGRHDELMQRGGLYAHLYALQFREKADPDRTLATA